MQKPNLLFTIITILLFHAVFSGTLHSETLKIPLYKIAAAKQIDLKCISAQHNISIPVPERWKIEKAILSFSYVNSTGLLTGKSRMVVKFNGNPISQINLNPLAPEGFVKLSLPAAQFEAGYNDLNFSVSQHYTTECEYPCSPDLWTTLRLDDAVLEMEYTLREVPLKLSAVTNFLFDPKISPQGEVNIVMPDMNTETVGIASIIASGVARRFDYRNVVFSISNDIKPGYDNILIGNKDFVGKFLKPANFDAEDIKGPFLKIIHLPQTDNIFGRFTEPHHAMIVVSGINTDHLKLAAETFAIMSIPFPDTTEMTAAGITIPEIPLYGGKSIIKADKKYTFKALNFASQTFRGVNAGAGEIVFRLPADFLIKQNLYAELSFHYAYGAALRSDSALNISLNGKLLRAIHLDDVRGALIEGYKLDIPTYLFKPGDNVLRFEPVLTPLVGKNCEYFQMENLFLTILDGSTLKFPPMPHYVDMPRLELFMLNGFPVTRWPDGHGSKIYLTNLNTHTIEAALNLVGIITQKNGHPLLEIQYTSTPPEKFNGELIIIGDIKTIPEGLKKLTPLALTRQTTVPYPISQSWADESLFAFSKQISGLSPGRGAVMEFQSPYADGRTVVLLTASSSKELLDMSIALMDHSVQSKIEGSLVLIDLIEPDKNIIALDIGERYFAGKAGPVSRLNAYLYTYPWLYYVMLGLVIIILSLILFFFLNKYRKRRIKG